MGSALAVAAAIGVVIAVQVGIIGRAAGRFDVLSVSLMLQIAGVSAGLLWVAARASWEQLLAIGRTWWWIPLGVAGWMIVAGLGFASSRAGVAAVVAVSVSSQLLTGLAIDRSTGAAIGPASVFGAFLLVAGAFLVARRL